jgi:hypothetical protein
MSISPAMEVAAALREFVERIDALDPTADGRGGVEISVTRLDAPLMLRPPVARALVEALRAYRDPRDRGTCDHCGGRRLDDNWLCADCGQPGGIFGEILRERAARDGGPPPAVLTDKADARQHRAADDQRALPPGA